MPTSHHAKLTRYTNRPDIPLNAPTGWTRRHIRAAPAHIECIYHGRAYVARVIDGRLVIVAWRASWGDIANGSWVQVSSPSPALLAYLARVSREYRGRRARR